MSAVARLRGFHNVWLAMDTIRFTGRVLPKVAKLNVSYPQFQWNEPELGLSTTWRLSIFNGHLEAECDIDEFLPERLTFYFIRATDLLQALTNIAAFSVGLAMQCSLEKFIDPNGVISSILPRTHFEASKVCTAYNPDGSGNHSVADVMVSVIADPELFLTLSDLVGSLHSPQISMVNCGRVIDSIRRMISPAKKIEDGWIAMQRALNISREYQEEISKISRNPRHGDRSYIQGSVTADITLRTWIILDRYLNYKLGGRKDLDVLKFPMLP